MHSHNRMVKAGRIVALLQSREQDHARICEGPAHLKAWLIHAVNQNDVGQVRRVLDAASYPFQTSGMNYGDTQGEWDGPTGGHF